jgi:hypothetical protein
MNNLTLSSPVPAIQITKGDPSRVCCAETEAPVPAHPLAANHGYGLLLLFESRSANFDA